MSGTQNKNTTVSNIVLPSKEQIEAGVMHHVHHTDDKDSSKQQQQQKPQQQQARFEHFQAAPGPVIPQDASVLGQRMSKEEMKARTEELNKD
ncbi:hypothetical protein DFH27DRAFT_165474 [Peziza echinospora]|nr:hypothetical protein DFH27DRAFT_165474 [Peziza echinospora]